MNSSRRWILIAFLLTAMAVATIYLFDTLQLGLSPAEKAYKGGWRTMTAEFPNPEGSKSDRPYLDLSKLGTYGCAADFRKAFEMKPTEPRYQLSLIQSLSDDPSALRAILKDKRLSSQARAMGEYHMTRADRGGQGYIQKQSRSETAQLEDKIRRLEAVKRLDPKNGLPCYDEAQAYYDLCREREGSLAIREGNSKSYMREYVYVDPQFARTIAGLAYSSTFEFRQFARRRELARCEKVYANRLLRARNVQEAMRVSGDSMMLGRRQAGEYPRTVMTYLVGLAISEIGESQLDSVYKDFGMLKEHEGLKLKDRAYRAGAERLTSHYRNPDMLLEIYHGRKSPLVLLDLWAFAAIGGTAVAGLTPIACLWWFAAWMLRRRARQEPFVLPVWRPWRLERLLAAIFLPLVGFCIAAVFVLASLSPRSSLLDLTESIALTPEVGAGLAVFLLLFLSLIVVRRDYAAKEGRIGWLPFLFRLPASHAAWRSRQVAGALAVALFVFVWMGLAVTLIHRPLLGAYPMQQEFVDYGFRTGEDKLVTETLKTIPQ